MKAEDFNPGDLVRFKPESYWGSFRSAALGGMYCEFTWKVIKKTTNEFVHINPISHPNFFSKGYAGFYPEDLYKI